MPQDVEPRHTDNAGAWEGIGEMPDELTAGAQVRLIMDQGYDELYTDQLAKTRTTATTTPTRPAPTWSR